MPEGQRTKEQFGVSMLSRKIEYTDSGLMKNEIHELVDMLNKDPDARISLDLLKCLSPDVRLQLLNSNLINNISDINRAYKAGKINESDWKSGVLLYKETKERCERQL